MEQDDEIYTLNQLMKYPPIKNIENIIDLAIAFHYKKLIFDGNLIYVDVDINSEEISLNNYEWILNVSNENKKQDKQNEILFKKLIPIQKQLEELKDNTNNEKQIIFQLSEQLKFIINELK